MSYRSPVSLTSGYQGSYFSELTEFLFSGATEHDVRLELVREEADSDARGELAIHDVSPSAFITAGLDLEEQQWVFSA